LANGLWIVPIYTAAATFKRQPSFAERLFPWRRMPVQLAFGTPASIALPEIISRLAAVLRSDNESCDYSQAHREDILAGLRRLALPTISSELHVTHDERAA
jgi:hypothetical protein